MVFVVPVCGPAVLAISEKTGHGCFQQFTDAVDLPAEHGPQFNAAAGAGEHDQSIRFQVTGFLEIPGTLDDLVHHLEIGWEGEPDLVILVKVPA